MKYVNGETDAIIRPQPCIGMKTPLIKTSGNLTRFEIIMTVDGMSVGGYADKRTPKDAKQKAAKTIPKQRTNAFVMVTPRAKPIIRETIEIESP